MKRIIVFLKKHKKEIFKSLLLLSILLIAIFIFRKVSPIYGRNAPRMILLSLLNVFIFSLVRNTYLITLSKRKRIVYTILYFLPEIFLIGILVTISLFNPLHEWSLTTFRSIFTGCCFALLYSKIFLIVMLSIGFLYMLLKRHFSGRRIRKLFLKNFLLTGFILSATFFALYLVSIAFGKSKLVVKEIEIPIQNLPAEYNNYRIVQISDIHSGSIYSVNTITNIVNQINKLSPDIICITGDIVNHSSSEIAPFLPEFKKMKSKEGIYAVLGNHDYNAYSYFKGERHGDHSELVQLLSDENGWIFLNNEVKVLRKNNDSLCLAGVENISTNPYFESRGDLHKTLSGIHKDSPVVLLMHDPSVWKDSVVSKYPAVSLTLSGHTHGMQFRIPSEGIRHFVYQHIKKELVGKHEVDEQYIYVNGGIGTSMLHGRLGAWMEVTLIVLKSTENSSEQ